MKKYIISLSAAAVLIMACCGSNPGKSQVKNIILIIGDGMGLTQVYSAMLADKDKLNIERAKFIGLSKTYSLNGLITDSGAGATAISTGHKANNHVIAVDTNGKPLKTIICFRFKLSLKREINNMIKATSPKSRIATGPFVNTANPINNPENSI